MAWMLGAHKTPEEVVERFYAETRLRLDAIETSIEGM